MKISCLDYASIVIATALFVGAPLAGAAAQTATDLKCNGCVGKKDIGKKAVTSRAIKKNAVKAKALKDGAVEASKLAADAKPAGASFASLPATAVPINQTAKVVLSVDVDAPAAGFVSLVASASFRFTGAGNLAACSLGTSEDLNVDTTVFAAGDGNIFTSMAPFSLNQVLPVATGTNTFNLVCQTDGATAVSIGNPAMTALFVPAEY